MGLPPSACTYSTSSETGLCTGPRCPGQAFFLPKDRALAPQTDAKTRQVHIETALQLAISTGPAISRREQQMGQGLAGAGGRKVGEVGTDARHSRTSCCVWVKVPDFRCCGVFVQEITALHGREEKKNKIAADEASSKYPRPYFRIRRRTLSTRDVPTTQDGWDWLEER